MKKFYLFLNILLTLGGCQAVYAQDSSICNAAFAVDVSRIQVTLRALDVSPGVLHDWNFGDGTTTSNDSVLEVHNYTLGGNYVITQVVIDTVHHCQDSS